MHIIAKRKKFGLVYNISGDLILGLYIHIFSFLPIKIYYLHKHSKKGEGQKCHHIEYLFILFGEIFLGETFWREIRNYIFLLIQKARCQLLFQMLRCKTEKDKQGALSHRTYFLVQKANNLSNEQMHKQQCTGQR